MSLIDPRRATPRMDAVLADPRLRAAAERLGAGRVHALVSRVLDQVRAGELPPDGAADAAAEAVAASRFGLRPVINATGVIIHTNLGRAPLSAAAVAAVSAASGYTDVEFDLTAGARRRRGETALVALAAAVPEAGAVHVVNNNAAALALVMMALAPGREVLLSRGEYVEIGDGFRLPELLAAAGARLREVGTTNRTRRSDYTKAVGPDTALILRIHPSNFSLSGFVASVPVTELSTIGPPVVFDVGSGLLRPHPALPDEPDVAGALRAGAALVTASGDKLLGGPQAGLIFGRADLVEQVRRHPMARAMRVDKLTLAALEATVTGPPAPVPAALDTPVAAVRARAAHLTEALVAAGIEASTVDSAAVAGGGGAPGVELPSAAVSLPVSLAAPLRTGEPAVVGRVHQDRCLLDLLTVDPDDDGRLLAAIRSAGER